MGLDTVGPCVPCLVSVVSGARRVVVDRALASRLNVESVTGQPTHDWCAARWSRIGWRGTQGMDTGAGEPLPPNRRFPSLSLGWLKVGRSSEPPRARSSSDCGRFPPQPAQSHTLSLAQASPHHRAGSPLSVGFLVGAKVPATLDTQCSKYYEYIQMQVR